MQNKIFNSCFLGQHMENGQEVMKKKRKHVRSIQCKLSNHIPPNDFDHEEETIRIVTPTLSSTKKIQSEIKNMIAANFNNKQIVWIRSYNR